MINKDIDDLYNILKANIDNIYKYTAIYNLKNKYSIEDSLSQYYYTAFSEKNKEKGVVYTPYDIAKYMIINCIKKEDIIKNPFLKIADPACGIGNIILIIFNYLYEIYSDSMDEINRNNIYIEESIEKHIVKNNLFCFDIDEMAIKIITIDLFEKSGEVKELNVFKKDFLLLENHDEKFDIIISNPPYVGHKSIDKSYSSILKDKFREIYKDKGDISYCFFQQAINKINKGGKIAFITSRYFLESPSGEELRKVLKEYCTLDKIVDFYGIRPFKRAGIDPVIIFFTKEFLNKDIEIIKPLNEKEKRKNFLNNLIKDEEENLDRFFINKNCLNNKGWILRKEEERNIIKKIEEKSFSSLANICFSYQGIITGCDKAFIIDDEIINHYKIEKDLIKPWIKSSNISKAEIKENNKYIIYADDIDQEGNYKFALDYISKKKEKLIQRRECRTGSRKWYQLQWGRKKEIFESEKIVFPYKSKNNRFSIDYSSYFSADVYCLRLRENVPYTYEYLINILNSKIYEFYFKTFGKKLGEDLYEYYPNNLMKLCIPTMMNFCDEEELYDYFDFTEEERKIIKSSI
ncbi:MAG: N-6 DNA methylase [Clostridiaceae bacterium]